MQKGKKPVDAASNKMKGEICATCFMRQGVVSGKMCQNTAAPYGSHVFRPYVPKGNAASSRTVAASA